MCQDLPLPTAQAGFRDAVSGGTRCTSTVRRYSLPIMFCKKLNDIMRQTIMNITCFYIRGELLVESVEKPEKEMHDELYYDN
jgi:hypothetical protein